MATRLFQVTGVEEQWHAVVAPWLRAAAQSAWQDARPTVVLTPSRAESFYLRGRLVRDGISFLGLRFWTPSDARTFLAGEFEPGLALATRAEQRLVARACAEKLLLNSDAAEPSLASVVREPGPFLRAYDLLLGAGWSPVQAGAVYGRKLAREFERALAERKVATQAGLHRALRRARRTEVVSPLTNLLVCGFNATHWPLWDLLRAVVDAAEETTMPLLAPRDFGAEPDQLWIGSWEQVTAAPLEITVEETSGEGAFAAWTSSYERSTVGEPISGDVSFVATPDLATQVDAIVLKAMTYLRDDSCRRLGIVFPDANALALGVAEGLRRLGIPLDDGTGCLTPGIFERRSWQTWLALQEESSVGSLIEWVRACEAENVAWSLEPSLPTAREIAGVLDDALGESLIDDLSFLMLHLEEVSTRNRARDVAGFLRRRVQLPESATFAEFLARTEKALSDLGWTEHLARLQTAMPAWLRDSAGPLSRRSFLEWLKEATDSRERTRGIGGNHFYGRVHLLIYAQMPGQTWTHLILTGLNEGQWPRVFEAGAFGSRHELLALNRQARGLNRLGTGEGRQGAGHETVLEERGYCLLPLEKQALALRDLCLALDGTFVAVCLAAMTADGGRALLPSDFFTHAYQGKTGQILDEAAFRSLAKATVTWCKANAPLLRGPAQIAKAVPDIATTQIAYAARRDSSRPFGRYEFSYAMPPPEPIQLACKTWETAWNHPASIWLERIVGLAGWPEGDLAWPRAMGTWVHRWLTLALKASVGADIPTSFLHHLREVADREPARILALAGRAGVTLYPWWNHVWGQARAIALGLGESLAPHLRERDFLSEYPLPGGLRCALPGNDKADFELRGKIDLILVDAAPLSFDRDHPDFTGSDCWVIDFKTGAAKNLTAKKLDQGAGLQALLYALAVHAAGAGHVALSLHTGDTALKPQVQLDDALSQTALYRSLERFHRDGIFGMRADAESDYGFAPTYPLATRPISAEVLAAKWALVHGTTTTGDDE